MSRRRPFALAVVALAVTALAGTALTPAAAAGADPADTGAPHPEKKVCGKAQPGFANCHAHVQTKADGVTPSATTGYTSGYRPADLVSAYTIPSSPSSTATPTVAVVDAYANPNALADLNTYRGQFNLPLVRSNSFTQVAQDGGSIATIGADVGWGRRRCSTWRWSVPSARSAISSTSEPAPPRSPTSARRSTEPRC